MLGNIEKHPCNSGHAALFSIIRMSSPPRFLWLAAFDKESESPDLLITSYIQQRGGGRILQRAFIPLDATVINNLFVKAPTLQA